MDHSLPFFLLLIEFIFLNSIPFVITHYFIMFPIFLTYILVNFCYQKIDGNPVYVPMNWDDLSGPIMTLLILMCSFVTFILLNWLSKVKLRCLGYRETTHLIMGKIYVIK